MLDGRNRLDALEAVGVDLGPLFDAARDFTPARQLGIRYVAEPGFISSIASENDIDPYAYVASMNLHRRHLTPAQQRELIDGLLKEKPERSDRETASIAKVDHKTVAARRRKLEAGGEVPHQERRVGKDGVAQAAAKKSTIKLVTAVTTAAAADEEAEAPSLTLPLSPDIDNKKFVTLTKWRSLSAAARVALLARVVAAIGDRDQRHRQKDVSGAIGGRRNKSKEL